MWTGDKVFGGRGESALAVGDFNGDGNPDLLVGDYTANVWGRAWYLQGERGGSYTGWRLDPGSGDIRFHGFSLADVGDVNGDGYSDVVVGAPHTTRARREYEGVAYLHLGGPGGLETNAVWRRAGGRRGHRFGGSVAAAGDVNQDGLADVLIGAPFADNGTNRNAGWAYLFLGALDGLEDEPAWIWKGSQPHGTAGRALAGIGDVNADGYPDVAVASPGEATRPGAIEFVAIFHGSSNGLPAVPSKILKADNPHCNFGYSIAAVGDLNRDGFDDIAIGAPDYSKAHPLDGRVGIYLGSTNGLMTDPVWTIEGGQESARCGQSLCAVGDINGDGFPDFAVGTPGYTGISLNQGRVDIFFGSTSSYVRVRAQTVATNELSSLMLSERPSRRPTWAVVVGVVVSAVVAFGFTIRQAKFRRLETDEERKRIARELHDRLGPQLSKIGLLVHAGAKLTPGTPEAEEHREKLERETRELHSAMETIIWSVKPANDHLESLVDFITQNAVPFCELAGIQCLLEISGNLPDHILGPDRRNNIFLAVMESLTNVVKHSGAREVLIRAEVVDQVLKILVADNGRGFLGNRRSSEKGDQDGLNNMRTRMKEVAGSIEIGPNDPIGTAVMMSVPLAVRSNWRQRVGSKL